MIKFFIKNFCNKNKLDEAKKRAMQMYDKLQNDQKNLKNKKVQEDFINSRIENTKEMDLDVKDYENETIKNKIGKFMEEYEFVDYKKRQVSKEGIDLNYYNKIKDDILYYKLNENFKNNIDKENWVKIYEAKYDPNFEKYSNYLNLFLKILGGYATFIIIRSYSKKVAKKENQ